MMTPKYREASVALLVKWAEQAHPEPVKFIRWLAGLTDDGLRYVIAEGHLDEHPDLPPESFFRAIKDCEEGHVVDMEKALTERPPWEPPLGGTIFPTG